MMEENTPIFYYINDIVERQINFGILSIVCKTYE